MLIINPYGKFLSPVIKNKFFASSVFSSASPVLNDHHVICIRAVIKDAH